jgi:hypothetical protein
MCSPRLSRQSGPQRRDSHRCQKFHCKRVFSFSQLLLSGVHMGETSDRVATLIIRMRASANSLAVPVLMACLCDLPASSAAERSSPNPHLRDTHSAYLQRAGRQPVECYPWGAEAWRRAREYGPPGSPGSGSDLVLVSRASEPGELLPARYSGLHQPPFCRRESALRCPARTCGHNRARPGRAEPARRVAAHRFPLALWKAIFGGGYLPRRPSRGKPAFRQVLEQALRIYGEQRTTIERDGFDLTQGE